MMIITIIIMLMLKATILHIAVKTEQTKLFTVKKKFKKRGAITVPVRFKNESA